MPEGFHAPQHGRTSPGKPRRMRRLAKDRGTKDPRSETRITTAKRKGFSKSSEAAVRLFQDPLQAQTAWAKLSKQWLTHQLRSCAPTYGVTQGLAQLPACLREHLTTSDRLPVRAPPPPRSRPASEHFPRKADRPTVGPRKSAPGDLRVALCSLLDPSALRTPRAAPASLAVRLRLPL